MSGVRTVSNKVCSITLSGGIRALMGHSGYARLTRDHVDFLEGKRDKLETIIDDDWNPGNQCALIIPFGIPPFVMSEDGRFTPVLQRLYATGGGASMAIGAMAAGASAIEAVRICIRHGDYAGLGIDWARFDAAGVIEHGEIGVPA